MTPPRQTNEMLARADVRLLIVGLLVLAVAGAAATGAFSIVTADRDVTVPLTTDANSLLAIRDVLEPPFVATGTSRQSG